MITRIQKKQEEKNEREKQRSTERKGTTEGVSNKRKAALTAEMVLAKPRKTWSIISILYVWIHRSSLLRSNTAASLWLQKTLLGRNEQPVPPLTLLCVCRTKTSLLDHVQIFRRKVFSTCFFSSTVLKWINLGQTV